MQVRLVTGLFERVGFAVEGDMADIQETELYPPVKAWLETLGYEVKAEVGPADVMACRNDTEPVIVELKTGFSLTLLQQAVARQSITDLIYVAVPRWKGRNGWRSKAILVCANGWGWGFFQCV